MAAGCSGASSPAAPARPLTQKVANGRFTVTFSGAALQAAQGAGINLPAVVGHALERINALLPGPATTIAVGLGPPGTVIPQTGANGMTGPAGQVTVSFRSTPQASLRTAVEVSLPRALSHEVDHSVRILAGPEFGNTLLTQIISEGISSVFDEAAFPGHRTPGIAPSRRARNASCGTGPSSTSGTRACTTCGCSAAPGSYRTGPGSPSATTSSRTTGTGIRR
jgi:Predicted Zn-dependent protease (DUF2268)